MARKANHTETRPYQDYEIGNGATVRIFYDPNGTKPSMLHDDDSALVSFDRDKFDAAKRAILMGGDALGPPAQRSAAQIPSRSRDLSPDARAAMLARIGEAPTEEVKVKP